MLNGESPATAVNVTDDREACPKQWVAALVKVHSERSAGKKLQDMGIECWVPTQSEVHQWSDRRKKVERVVIPMIIFVHVPQSDIRQLAFHPFILKLLTAPGQRTPAIIPDAQIQNLRFMLGQSEAQVEMRERILRTGDHVRIVRGPLQGLEGELCKVEDGKPMVAVRVDGLGYACISIDKADLVVK
ncbi:MAG: UpxY family transcription antiterminator [Bacteroidaceae bacterium]|nr:UpxY family transcription antiterminator [Bacteroidaceae bacterium]